jgi:hypothetical protein
MGAAVTSESTQGWAFLVARGRQTGYQLLLAPDFIMTGRESALLMDEIRGEVPMHGPPVVADNAGPTSGPRPSPAPGITRIRHMTALLPVRWLRAGFRLGPDCQPLSHQRA